MLFAILSVLRPQLWADQEVTALVYLQIFKIKTGCSML